MAVPFAVEYYNNLSLVTDAQQPTDPGSGDPTDHIVEIVTGNEIVNDRDFGNRRVEVPRPDPELDCENHPLALNSNGNVRLRYNERNGVLRINGTRGSDAVGIHAMPTGDYMVHGFGNTSVNDEFQPVFIPSIERLIVNLRGGNDLVCLEGININGRTNINLGGGNDVMFGDDLNIGGVTTIRTGHGHDDAWLTRTNVNSHLRALTDGGDDAIAIIDTNIQGDVLARLGVSDDLVFAWDSRFNSDIDVLLDGGDDLLILEGNDLFGDGNLSGGGGFDAFDANGDLDGQVLDDILSGFEEDSLSDDELEDILEQVMQDLADVGLDGLLDD